jgi:hypothetical protein
VTGVLVIPALPGGPGVRAALTVLREGQAVATAEAAAGLFRVEYPREAGDATPFTLRAEAPRRAPVLVALPSRTVDAGEVRLLAGLVYGGRLLDARGLPVPDVVVDFTIASSPYASSAPSGADGSFLIPLPQGVSLQGLFGEPQSGWEASPTLEPKARGRLFLPVETKPEGLSGGHEIVLEERPVAIRLRFLDEATGRPVAGAAVTLWSAKDFGFILPSVAPLDAGSTDDLGVFAPLWPLGHKQAFLRVREPGGRVLWTKLDRAYAEGKEPVDLLLPEDPPVLAVRFIEGDSGKPVAGARVVLGTNACPVAGTTDARGEIRWAFFPSESFDPEPLEVRGWSAEWRDAAGNPRREMDMDFRGPPHGDEERSPVYSETIVVRLGKRGDRGIWVRVEESRGAPPFEPQCLQATHTPGKGGFLTTFQRSGPVADAAGRSLWWFWEWASEENELELLSGPGAFTLELLGADRAPLVRPGDRAAVLAAHRSEGALVFAAPPVDVMERSLLVVGPDGKPEASVLIAVLAGLDAGTNPFEGQQERERGATGTDGRAALRLLDPGGDCRIAAWDPATGNSGLMKGLDPSAPPERWRLALEPPREFRVRVKFAGGGTLTGASAILVPLSSAFPRIPQVSSRDGELVVPACPVPVCLAWITGNGPRNEIRFATGPAATLEGKDVVLEKR